MQKNQSLTTIWLEVVNSDIFETRTWK